jgi:hypothetical protein
MRLLALCSILPLAACAGQFPPPPGPIGHVDHVIVGVSDLDDGISQLEQLTGVRAVPGGSHPGRGTRNALMSLGDGTYLELLAPDPAQSADSPELRELRSLTKLTPIGWAASGVSEQQLRGELVARGILLSESEPGSRRKLDGSVLQWVTFGYRTIDDPLAPFFIFWADPAAHPSRTSPGGCRLGGMAIHHVSAQQFQQAIAPLGLAITVSRAPGRRMLVTLRCGGRGVILGRLPVAAIAVNLRRPFSPVRSSR